MEIGPGGHSISVRGSGGHAPEWLVSLVRMIAVEMASTGPGSEAVVTRLTDALLAQALRQCLAEADRAFGGATAVSDPQIARALRLIREHPDRHWTVPTELDALPHGASRRISPRHPGGDPRDRAADRIRLRGFRDEGVPPAISNLTRGISKECADADRRTPRRLACGGRTRAKWRKPRRGPGLSERGSPSLGCRSARLGRWGEPEVGKDGARHEVKADVNPTDRHEPEGVVEEDADNAERQ